VPSKLKEDEEREIEVREKESVNVITGKKR